MRAAETDKGIYLYCFFEGPASIPPQKGINETNDTFVLSEGNTCALASEVPAFEYSEDRLNRRLRDLKWLIPKVMRHDELIRYAMKTRPVIPVKFGAIFTSCERVLDIMRRGSNEFHDFFDFIRDKEEWGVKVYVDERSCRKAMESSSDLIRELDRKISLATPGNAYFIRKKRENLLLRETLCLHENLADEIYQRIAPQCVDARKNKLLGKEATNKKEKMILNTAVLLGEVDADFFKKKLDGMAVFYEPQGILIEISGPWPPYNFCPDFEAVREACAV
ncbi:MAG: GvpL/GvpF family gas vesicle protein [bacterium]